MKSMGRYKCQGTVSTLSAVILVLIFGHDVTPGILFYQYIFMKSSKNTCLLHYTTTESSFNWGWIMYFPNSCYKWLERYLYGLEWNYMVWSENCMVWSEIVWFQIMNLMVWAGSGVGQSVDGWVNAHESALIWMILNLTEDKSTLVQVMAWCRQATGHYLS